MRFQRSKGRETRRGFVRQCLGVGASLTAAPLGSSLGAGSVKAPWLNESTEMRLSDYERILSHSECMQVLGNPRSWSLVSQQLHPFAPERAVVLPSDERSRYHDRCGKQLRCDIDKRIKLRFGHLDGHDPRRFPESKRESIYWIADIMTGHYGVSRQFAEWVVGMAGREIIGSTALCACALAHEYQRGGPVPVDCPPVDWWLFLFPGGIDWAALDDQPIFALMAHVFRNDPSAQSWLGMYPIWILAQELLKSIPDWSQIARMGRLGACRHLNGIVAHCLTNKPR